MPKTLFYCVGNSDVIFNDYSRFGNFYETTKELSSFLDEELKECHAQKVKLKRNRQGYDFQFVVREIKIPTKDAGLSSVKVEKIEFPIFVPLMENLNKEKLDKIYLFATEQEPANPQDTMYAASLIKTYANEKYNIEDVEIIRITQNPSDYDLMAQFFTEFFEKKRDEIKNNIENFIALSAGTPAMITSVALNSIGLPVKYFYIMRKKPYSEALEVNVFHQINLERYVVVIEPLIRNYEYTLASEVVKKSPLRSNFQLLNLIEIMDKRVSFNFKEAMKLIHECDNELKEKLIDISRLAQGEKNILWLEIFSQIEINFSKRDYLTGTAFIFSLMENIRNWFFEEKTKVRLKKVKDEFIDFNKYIEDNPCLKEHLEKKKCGWRNSPNRVVLLEILNWINEKNPDELLAMALNFIKKVETQGQTSSYGKMSLADLRNKGPFAHGTTGISEELLKQIYPPYGKDGIITDIKDFLLNLCKFQGAWHNPYDLINEEIIRLMKS